MRKLATIRTIADVQPIAGADAIEVVTVGGWKVVAKKGEFEVDDLCVYFEIDSVLPVCEQFEFLRKSCHVKKDWLVSEQNPTGEGFRLKTIKLRKQISQGLVVPLSGFEAELADRLEFDKWSRFTDGMNVTEALGVVKWDPPVPAQLAGKVKDNFPSFIPKTDQERVQNLRNLNTNDSFEVTIKLDGSSFTAYKYNEKVGVCSRNLELDWENDTENAFCKLFIESGLKYALELSDVNIAIQGELMGPGIQGNRESLNEVQLFIYDIYDIDEGVYLPSYVRQEIVEELQQNGVSISHVPTLGIANIRGKTVEDILAMAEGPSLNHKIREGIVFKSVTNPDLSFKAVSNKYLLRED